MNRFILAAALATSGFVAAAGPLLAQTTPPAGDNPDRVMTREDTIARTDRRFDLMDVNRDGKLDRTELQPRRAPGGSDLASPPPAEGAAPPPPTPGRADRMFARLDTNGDGVIDREEFRASALRRFDRMDANKDGKIDAAERQAARDAMGMRGERGPGGDMPPPPPADAPKPDAGQ